MVPSRAGLIASSNSQSTLNAATFDNVLVQSSMPAGWTGVDVGTPAMAGSTWYDGTTWTLSGSAITYDSDTNLQFASTMASGDTTFIAHVASMTYPDQWSASGIMFRSSSAVDAATVFLQVNLQGVMLTYRDADGSWYQGTGAPVGPIAPVWLKLVRQGDQFTGYYSTDAINWTQVGTTVTAEMPHNVQAGLAAGSDEASQYNISQFDNVSMVDSPGIITIPSPATFESTVGHTATVALPFTDTDPTTTDTATINWGDGTTSAPDITTATITEPSGTMPGTINATHIYHTAGTDQTTVTIQNTDGSTDSASGTVTVSYGTPKIETPAAGTVSADGKSIALSVLGSDDLGESGLTYTWATILQPDAGNATVSANDTNAAKNATATIGAAGDYLFDVEVTNAAGLSVTSDVIDVTVNQVPTGTLSVSPSTDTVAAGSGDEFTASGNDQFGNTLTDTSGANWSVAGTDTGTINDAGWYDAPTDNGGTFTITVSSPEGSGSASVSVPASTPELTADEASDGSHVDVNWDFDNSGFANAAGFDLLREVNNSGIYTNVSPGTAPTTTGFTDTDVSNGNTYTYILKPYVLSGGSKIFGTPTAQVSVTMVGMITATPSSDPILVSSSGTGSSLATISLPFSDSDSSDTHTATIDWGDGSSSNPDVTAGTVTEPSGSTAGTVAGTHSYPDGSYTITVTIDNSDGSTTQEPIEIEVGGIPNAPSSATATVSAGTVTVNWSAPSGGYAPTGYTIYGSTDGGTTWTAVDEVDSSTTTDALSGLTPSTSYLFHVTATNDFGESAASSATTAITSPAAPASPTDLTASLAAGNIVLNWTAADSLATSFNIYESTDGGTTFNFFDSVTPATAGDAPATTYTATGLTTGTTPQFYVTAMDASGESAASSTVGVISPTSPTGVAVTLSSDDTSATISWTQVASAIGYYVTRTNDDDSTVCVLPEVTPGTVTSIVDDHDGTTATTFSQSAFSYTVTAVYPTSIAIGGSGGSGGSGGGSGGGGGGGSGGGSGDPSGGSSTGTGTSASSDPTDDSTGNVSLTSTVNSDGSVTLDWTYQGSANFELEEEDTDTAGTNFAFIGSPGGRSTTVSGLNPGDNYGFRIRADRPDGTVSGYANASADIPPTPPSPPPDDSRMTLGKPNVSIVSTDDYGVTVSASAPSNPRDSSLSDFYLYSFGCTGRVGDKYDLENGSVESGETAYDGISNPQTMGFFIEGTTGATYTFTGGISDGDTDQYSPQSGPLKFTLPGSIPPKLSLSADKPDASGNFTLNWTPPAGIDQGNVYFYYMGRQNGQEVPIGLDHSLTIDVTTGSQSFNVGGIPLGNVQIFGIYYGSGSDGAIFGYSDYSNQVMVKNDGGAPAAPAEIAAGIEEAGVGEFSISAGWQNTSNNETGFTLQQSIDGGSFEDVESTGQDGTAAKVSAPVSQLESLPAAPTLAYRAIAKGTPTNSTPSPVATIALARGGPDITANLNWLAGSVKAMFATANTQLVPGNSGLTVAADNLMRGGENILNGWDIAAMADGNLSNALQTLPETCTVKGGVYDESAVNYFLAGLMEAMMQKYDPGDARLFEIAQNYVFLAHLGSSDPHDHPLEKLAWFGCGMKSAQAGSLTGVPPTYYPNALPNPEGPKPGHFGWHIEDLGETDPN